MSALLPVDADLDDRALGTRDAAAHQQEVLVATNVDDRQPLLRAALVAHLARPADALEDARGGRGLADRARRAHVVRAVADGAAGEVVALDGSGEALALRDSGDLDRLALLEDVGDLDLRADVEVGTRVAELDQAAQRRGVGLLEVAELGAREALLADVAVGELDRVVAVAIGGALAGDPAGAGLDDGHALDVAVLGVEDLRHAQLASQHPGHQISWIWMSTPAGRWSRRWSESTVFGVGWRMSISRLCVRISKCSRESLSLNGLRMTQ